MTSLYSLLIHLHAVMLQRVPVTVTYSSWMNPAVQYTGCPNKKCPMKEYIYLQIFPTYFVLHIYPRTKQVIPTCAFVSASVRHAHLMHK